MKKHWLLAAALLAAWAAPGLAQDRTEAELTRQEIESGRREIVAAAMQLTDEQAEGFWPVYREYRAAFDPIGDREVKLLTNFAEKYGSMTDEDAEGLLKEMMSIQDAKLSVQKKYVNKFKKVLPMLQVGRFYQIEYKLDAVIRFDLAANIPLVR